MANFMLKMQVDNIALIILIWTFKNANRFFSSKSGGVIVFSFGHVVKKLLAKQNIDAVFSPILL